MFLIGLTGGIAAGKSTVANVWQRLGALHIDADQLAREVVEPGTPGLRQVVDEFGLGVLAPDGSLDRSALAAIVFQDPDKRAKLEGILHPLIQERTRELLQRASQTLGPERLVVYSIPLLVETDSPLPFDAVVTVEAPEQKQIDRLVQNRGLTLEQAKSRIGSQATPAERARRADYILNSNQAIELLERDARELLERLQLRAIDKAAADG